MTNGRKTLDTFPNTITKLCKNKELTYIELEKDDKWIGDINLEWWNSEYKEQDSKDDMIDKIKAEIEQNAYPIVHGVNNHEKGMSLYGILRVLDKFKNESES